MTVNLRALLRRLRGRGAPHDDRGTGIHMTSIGARQRAPHVETLKIDLSVPDEFCCICKKAPKVRLVFGLVYRGEPASVSVCRDCLAEYSPEALAAIEAP